MICALLLVAKYDRSEHHSLYFMAIQRSLISLLVKGIKESLKALFLLHGLGCVLRQAYQFSSAYLI